MQPRVDTTGGLTGAIVYWLLVCMGVSSLAMCVLWPEWREHQAIRTAEQVQRRRVESLRRTLRDEHRRLEALQDDPAVIARLARRELNYRGPSDRLVSVMVASTALDVPRSLDLSFDGASSAGLDGNVQPLSISPPFAAFLPQYDYDHLFSDDRCRWILATLSVGLLVVAVILFRRRPVDNPYSTQV